MRKTLGLIAIVLGAGTAGAQMDPSFAPCSICHTVAPNQNRIGPTLNKIVGRPKASVPGFAYSPAMKAQKGVWSEAELDAFIANPKAKVPGTRMVYAGMTDPAKRARLIAWLKSIK
ncbi:putative cytochrome c [Sphingomonas changbaiensis NBRC 104936]|uniref:Putative cytochrome c n=1 Tax=Sphingomonas changbaiensis NBRC 104936 TaxID=1219043 RepID=A0A0E9MTF9_9SPHN|nr:c-type cytochrome [Sphingomonas changbaiensis]GAO40721.1 putative cytochrome c [Sphingomonas changbaiensis NBRC 104936]